MVSVSSSKMSKNVDVGLPLLTMGAGGLSVVYSASLAALGKLLASPIWATPIAYAEALPVMILAICLSPRPRLSKRMIIETYKFVIENPLKRWPILCGGLLGASIGVIASYVPPVIGMGAFFVLFVAGQVLMALFLDSSCLLWSNPTTQPLHAQILGSCIVVLGAATFQWSSIISISASGPVFWCILTSLAAGIFAVMQGAVNRKLTEFTRNNCTTATFSLSTGLLLVIPPACILCPKPNLLAIADIPLISFWKCIGGILTMNTLCVMMIMPKYLGYALTACWLIVGELVVSLVSDQFGWLEMKQRNTTWERLIGLSLVIGGVLQTQLSRDQISRQCILETTTPKKFERSITYYNSSPRISDFETNVFNVITSKDSPNTHL